MDNPTNIPTCPTALPKQSLMIKNLIPSLMEWGKIKIGRKGKLVRNEFRMPEKLDHFLITTMQRDEGENYILDHELMNKIMERYNVDVLKKIPITLLYNDIELNLQSRYACFKGKTKWCTGNGETAMRLSEDGKLYAKINCPCERAEFDYPGEDGKGKGKCKTTGCLSCLINGADRVGGVWKFRTTSFNSVRSLYSSMLIMRRLTGGILAGIPFELTVSPKTTNEPITGKTVTVYIVNIEYAGAPSSLRDNGYEKAKLEAVHQLRIEHIEEEAKKLLLTRIDEEVIGDEETEHVEEFHPEEINEEENKVGNGPGENEHIVIKGTEPALEMNKEKIESIINPPKEEKPRKNKTNKTNKNEKETDLKINDPEDKDFDLF